MKDDDWVPALLTQLRLKEAEEPTEKALHLMVTMLAAKLFKLTETVVPE